ncbi:MAG: response regulator [Pseudomonadota bacterium]
MKTNCILLVEDNPDDAELAIRAFQRTPVKSAIAVARDGVEALDYLHAQAGHAGSPPPPPGVMLLDLNLPRMDGLEVLRNIRANERTRRLPVVVMSSSTEETDILRSYELGANSYVRKPVSFAEFVEAANKVGAYWLTLNQPAPRI